MKVTCMLNNKQRTLNTYSDKPLNRVLEEETEVTSLTSGCYGGYCGNCVVLIDEKPQLSCLVPAFSVHGKSILTFEGFSRSKFYTDIRRAYREHGIQPCNYCYASKTLLIHGLLIETPDPEQRDILQTLSVNTCTCIDRSELVNVVTTAAKFRRRKRRVQRS
ncbi:MAG: (2Fe-2S)-binding protein [Spirochaetota bacterium]